MRRLALLLLAAALWMTAAGGALARDAANSEGEPLGDLLNALSQRYGASFVFDSRLVKEAVVTPMAIEEDFENPLRERLGAVGLELHRTGDGAFAITRVEKPIEPAPPASPEMRRADAPLDLVIVTAAATTRIEAPGADHLYAIDSDQLSLLKVDSTADAIYELPMALASFTRANTALFGALSGIDLADLRGLSPARTAVRVNGAERTLTPGGNGDIVGVDLNSLPEPFLERIEVLSATSLARHGAGAEAGVVNFVVKSNLQGLRLTANGGISQKGDSERISMTAVGGRDFLDGAANVTAGASLARNEGLIGADREATAVAYGYSANGRLASPGADFLPGFGGSSYTRTGIIGAAVLADGSLARFPGGRRYVPGGPSGAERFVGSIDQLYDAVAELDTIIPSDQAHAFLTASYEPAEATRFKLSLFGGLTANDVTLAPLPGARGQGIDPLIGDAVAIDVNSPTVPAELRQFLLNQFGPDVRSLVLERRYVELGPRRQDVDRNYLDLTAGVERALGDRARIEFNYRYGRAGVSSMERNRVDRSRLLTALDPVACAAAPECAPADFFSPTGLSAAAADFIRAGPERQRVYIRDHELNITARRTLGANDDEEIFAGLQLRASQLSSRFDKPPDQLALGSFLDADFAGALRTGDLFAGAEFIPLTDESPFGAVKISVTGRLSASPSFGLAPSFDGAATWSPVDGLSAFTRQSRGDRAPNVVELVSIGDAASMSFIDPCASPSPGSNAAANCAAPGSLGVPAGFTQTALAAPVAFYGNPDLRPERAAYQAYGVDISPTDWFDWIPGRLKLVATWSDLKIRNQIVFDSAVLDSCYASPSLSDPYCGVNPATGAPAIVRDPATRQITRLDIFGTNAGEIDWRGLDLELRYAIEPAAAPFDRLWISALHTYTNRVRTISRLGDVDRLDGLVDYPKHRSQAVAGVEIGNLELVCSIVRRGAAVTARVDVPEVELGPAIYVDAAARLAIGPNLKLQFGVENIANRDPPIVAFSDTGNTPREHYDIVGRRFTLGVRADF